MLQLLSQMEEEGIEPDTLSYNCALAGLAKRRRWYRACGLFDKIVRTGLSPNVNSYNELLTAAGMGSESPRRNMVQVGMGDGRRHFFSLFFFFVYSSFLLDVWHRFGFNFIDA